MTACAPLDNDKMLTDLRRIHDASKGVRPVALAKTGRSGKPYDFAKHPAYGEVRVAKAASDVMGVASPFFRSAQAVEGTQVKINGRWLENFGSYDYLGLNRSPELRDRTMRAVEEWGVSSTASRVVGGERSVHDALERRLAEFTGNEAALAFVSGHATNIAAIRTLVGPGDMVMVDALAHNSVYEGIRASGASHFTFPHNDVDAVEAHLEDVRDRFRNVIIAIEGLYSMDGDTPDLARFVDVKQRYGCWLMVDEAHSLGVVGRSGRGICEATGVDPAQVEITMGTLSKTFASCGGFIAGSQSLIELLKFKSPGFVYSVGLSAPNAAAALAAVDLAMNADDRIARLQYLGGYLRSGARELGLDCGLNEGFAVAPIIVGDSLKAVQISNELFGAGFNVLPVIYPAVPERLARLRLFLNYGHTEQMIDQVLLATRAALIGSVGHAAE